MCANMKKAQTSITLVFFLIVALIIWAMFAAPLIAAYGALTVTNGGLTGIEAFFFLNINFVIGFVLVIAILSIAAYGLAGGK